MGLDAVLTAIFRVGDLWAGFYKHLPDPTLKLHCIAHLKVCDRWITDRKPIYKATAQPEQKKAICQWLMKRVVRSLFEAIMFDLNCYSRDIYPCA